MTNAPPNLLAVRRLLLDKLNMEPTRVRDDDLEPAEVGIVGDQAHADSGDSYHLGEPEQRSSGYSVSESPRDRAGLDVWACAVDVGQFEVVRNGRTYDLPHFSAWCVGQCRANAPDTRDIREIIWSPDGRTVLRWDRLGRRTTGDSSHRWHTHFSWFRDAIKAGRDQTPLFRRYLTTIGLLEDDDMTPEEHAALMRVDKALAAMDGRNTIGQAYTRIALGEDHLLREQGKTYSPSHPSLKSLGAQLAALQNALSVLAGKDFTDEPAIVQGVLAGLTPDAIAAAIPPTVARQVADELTARLAD